MPRVHNIETWSGDALEAAKKRLIQASKVKIVQGTGTGAHNACYGGLLADQKAVYVEHACHAFMKQLVDCRVAFSRMVHSDKQEGKKTQEATKAWFNWITGPDSPWREVFPLGMSLGDRPEFRKPFWWRYGFLFDRLDVVPANLLHNFLVATRQPHEWPYIVVHWHRMVKAGCTEPAALFFASMFRHQRENRNAKVREWSNQNGYDFPLDTATCDETYLVNFCAGITPGLGKPFVECKIGSGVNAQIQYTPVNAIWGKNNVEMKSKGNSYYGDAYCFTVRDTYSKQIGTRIERENIQWGGTKFPKYPIIDWELNDEQVIEVVKAEERRLQIV